MKHLKTFESFSLNEEEEWSPRKFFTGHESDEDKNKAMVNFTKALDAAEADVNKSPDKYSFNRADLEKKAKENNYLGGLRIQRGGNSKKLFVVYDEKESGWNKVISAASVIMK